MADLSSETSGVSGRYATALFELARDGDALDAVAGDLDQLDTALSESADLRDLVASPIYTRAQQGEAIGTIAKRMELSELTRHLLGLMAQKRRLFVLSGVIRGYRALLADLRGEVTAEVTSATKLTDAQTGKLQAELKKSVGKDVTLKQTVDETLIGGLIVKVGSRMIDTSIRARLAALQNNLKEVG